ncbi:F-box only protein 6-like [Iris pallida]|uniref:F-box only protein 6-like n=1 Tax=Iris pallida TaxID=29817 RepID=A0AAX6FG77_IRIPA|nr:F-box only protein 6-like [Iris pallida]KAJ6836655.1 F-box only protein 6-like [Iris pallida]
MRTNPDGIVSYDVVTGAWKQLIVPFPPHLTYWTLAESGGQVLLVGLLSKNAATCIGVWELQKMTLLWKEGGGQNAKLMVLRVLWEAHLDELYRKPGIAYAVPDVEAVAEVGQLRFGEEGVGKGVRLLSSS